MPARDKFHNAVKQALIKDGWLITDDPLQIKSEDVEFFVDLGAEKLLGAEKAGHKIAVEIKSFLGTSHLNDLHGAVGQFVNYRIAMARSNEAERTLFLGVPLHVYDPFFDSRFVRTVIEEVSINLVVYDVDQEVIVLWNEQPNIAN
jgi:hypothetical protein